MSPGQHASDLFKKIKSGDRVALSRAITLIESRQASHIEEANALLDACVSTESSAMRIAITGAPGVGKSSFIEVLSRHILEEDHRLAVLAVDPTSQFSGGSLLGDKTRMYSLASHPNAYIRPSPSGIQAGGVADRTREAIVLCEAAGFDIVVVETVGVGQSEVQVRTMVDLLLLLLVPGGGDEVQGIKRGILEAADIVAINKADGDLKKQARQTQAYYTQALRVIHMGNVVPPIFRCSALDDTGVSEIWTELRARFTGLHETGSLTKLRDGQNIKWFEYRIRQDFIETLMHHPEISVNFEKNKKLIGQKELSVRTALSEMREHLEEVLKDKR